MDEKLLSIAHAPDQKLQAELVHRTGGGLAFRILYDGTLVLSSSRIGIAFCGEAEDCPGEVTDHAVRPLPFGGTELFVRLDKNGREIAVRLLVTNDRVAFRYEFEKQASGLPFREKTSFLLALDGTCLAEEPSKGLAQDLSLALPVLFELDNGLYMSLDRLPNAPEVYTLDRTEGRLLTAVYHDLPEQKPIESDVTPWWIISFTHP